jgi:hypothetical protein
MPPEPDGYMKGRLNRILAEPLLHFTIIGAVLFGAYTLVREPAPGSTSSASAPDHRVLITAERIEQLANGWEEMWGRPPTDQELGQLVDDEVRDEILYREGMAQGLTQNDEVIRQHLRDKMLAIAEAGAELSEPTEGELQDFYNAHLDDFRIEPLLSFAQIFLESKGQPQQVEARAAELIQRLNSGEVQRPWELSDETELPHELGEYPESDIRLTFGPEFVQELRRLERGKWQGPVRSKLGLHLVRAEEWAPARVQSFDEVREEVKGRWIDQRIADARNNFYAPIRDRYTIVIDRPADNIARTEPTGAGP